jgi:chorismate mutase
MRRLEDLSKQADLDPDLAKKFLTFIISEVIRHHEKLQK